MLPAAVDMAAVAAFRGVHYDTVRKQWPTWVRDDGFPPPIENRAPYRWRAAALTAWAERREAETRAALLADATDPVVPANENTITPPPGPPHQRRIERQRDAVLALMSRPQAVGA